MRAKSENTVQNTQLLISTSRLCLRQQRECWKHLCQNWRQDREARYKRTYSVACSAYASYDAKREAADPERQGSGT